jgi:protoheme ferro-lyase
VNAREKVQALIAHLTREDVEWLQPYVAARLEELTELEASAVSVRDAQAG